MGFVIYSMRKTREDRWKGTQWAGAEGCFQAAMDLGGRSHTHQSSPILSSQKKLLPRSLAQAGDSPAQVRLESHWRRPCSANGQEKDPHFVPRETLRGCASCDSPGSSLGAAGVAHIIRNEALHKSFGAKAPGYERWLCHSTGSDLGQVS